MAQVDLSDGQILAEWPRPDPVADAARWREGMSRYEAGSLQGAAEVAEAAESMCAGLAHYVAGSDVITGWAGSPRETAVARTIWNVLIAVLQGDGEEELDAASARRLRLALAALRRGGYQPAGLGGNDFMARFFDARSQKLMTQALSGAASAGAGTASLRIWFTSGIPLPVADGEPGGPVGYPGDDSPPDGMAPAPGSKWDALRDRTRQAQQHVNPVALQHGIEAVQGALTESRIAKIDKSTGKLKVKKLGIARAAIRPTKTLRQAIDGAALAERLKAYNDSTRPAPPARTGGNSAAASGSAAEFSSCGSKQEYLRDWARRLVVAAGVPPTDQLVRQHADMAAAGIRFMVFLRIGASHGISDLGEFFRPGPMPDGTPLETFDALYAKVVQLTAQQRAVDEGIAALLASSWNEWTASIREGRS